MLASFQTFLKNSGCSYCQENDYNDSKETYSNWSLYIKEYEMYSSLILYHNKMKKDISYYIKQNEPIKLLKKNKIILEVDYISKDDANQLAILVPLEKYQEYYENIEKKSKNFNHELKAYLIDHFDILIKK